MIATTAQAIWNKIQEFMGRIDSLEDDSKETKLQVDQMRRELALMQREMDHNDKIQRHQGHAMAEMEERIKKLESEKRGKAISAGKAKAKLIKLQEERDRRSPRKPDGTPIRH